MALTSAGIGSHTASRCIFGTITMPPPRASSSSRFPKIESSLSAKMMPSREFNSGGLPQPAAEGVAQAALGPPPPGHLQREPSTLHLGGDGG